MFFFKFNYQIKMNHIKKAFLDTMIMAGIILIITIFQKSPKATYGALVPITGIACYNLIKAAYFIYKDKKNGSLN